MKIYMAGPEVFLPDAITIGQRKRDICERHGLTGLYPLAVRLFAEGRLRISGNTVNIDGAAAPEGVMLNPPEALVSRAG